MMKIRCDGGGGKEKIDREKDINGLKKMGRLPAKNTHSERKTANNNQPKECALISRKKGKP